MSTVSIVPSTFVQVMAPWKNAPGYSKNTKLLFLIINSLISSSVLSIRTVGIAELLNTVLLNTLITVPAVRLMLAKSSPTKRLLLIISSPAE